MKAKNAKLNQQMEETNRQRLEEAEQKAKNAQPIQRAKNVAGYVSEGLESAANTALNKLQPPNKRK